VVTASGSLAVTPDRGWKYSASYVTQSLELTFANVPVRFVPTVVIAVIAATAISVAIRPYSMAVAPLSLRRNFSKTCVWAANIEMTGTT
jgi:hypothetical protein